MCLVDSLIPNEVLAVMKTMNKSSPGLVGVLGDSSLYRNGIQAIPYNIPSLDKILGGGSPRGRMIEIYGNYGSGKSSLTYQLMGSVQETGGICAYIDVEHSFNPNIAKQYKVEAEKLIFVQPNFAEEALGAMETLAQTGKIDLIVLDSVAALTAKAEVDKGMTGESMALQARLMSKHLRIMTPYLHNRNDDFTTTLVYVNQIRQKVGVVYGCFHYDTRVMLADGSSERIGKIVNGKLPVKVLSFNPHTRKCEEQKVIGWHDNGIANKFLQFEVERCGGSGTSKFGVTENHIIFTPEGEKPAGVLKPGDLVLAQGQDKYEMVPVTITNIYEKPRTRSMHKFDLTVEGHHTYLVDGVGVHNSPEVTSGGMALPFYASQRLRISSKPLMTKQDAIGQTVSIKVTKNRIAPPHQSTTIDLVYGLGFDVINNLAKVVLEEELCGFSQSGAWVKRDGESICQGKDAFGQILKDDPELYNLCYKACVPDRKENNE